MTKSTDVSPEVREVWNRTGETMNAHRHESAKWKGDSEDCARRLGVFTVTKDSTILEWGSGGCGVMRALPKPAKYIAVDVSTRARRIAAAEGPHVQAIDPAEVAEVPSQSVDGVLSFACFQHFENREYADAVMREISRVLKPSGWFVIQTRYYEPGDNNDPSKKSVHYEDRFIRSLAYRIDEFPGVLAKHGLDAPGEVTFDHASRYAFYRGTNAATKTVEITLPTLPTSPTAEDGERIKAALAEAAKTVPEVSE